MLVNARKLTEFQIWTKSFQTHYLGSVFDKKSSRNRKLKFKDFLIFPKNGEILNEKCFFVIFFKIKQQIVKLQFTNSRWIFVENTLEIMRLKALCPYLKFLQVTSIHEYLASTYEQFKGHWKTKSSISQFRHFFTLLLSDPRRWSDMLVKCSQIATM